MPSVDGGFGAAGCAAAGSANRSDTSANVQRLTDGIRSASSAVVTEAPRLRDRRDHTPAHLPPQGEGPGRSGGSGRPGRSGGSGGSGGSGRSGKSRRAEGAGRFQP